MYISFFDPEKEVEKAVKLEVRWWYSAAAPEGCGYGGAARAPFGICM
jgi:hypothetical protein